MLWGRWASKSVCSLTQVYVLDKTGVDRGILLDQSSQCWVIAEKGGLGEHEQATAGNVSKK